MAKACLTARLDVGGLCTPDGVWPTEVDERESVVSLLKAWHSALSCATLAAFAMGNAGSPVDNFTLDSIMQRPLAVTAKDIIREQDVNAAMREAKRKADVGMTVAQLRAE